MSPQKVLVIASDVTLSALVGSLVENARLVAAFPKAAESPSDALLRTRPVAAIVLDIALAVAESDLFLATARRGGVQVILFGSLERAQGRRTWAVERGVPLFALPNDIEALAQALQALTQRTASRTTSRRAPHTERERDGTLIFDDGAGTRWSVYDRRKDRDRRLFDRRFVSDGGEVRHCEMTEAETSHTSARDLADQLARSTLER